MELAKVIISQPQASNFLTFLEFDRKIFLVRDPRDWLISGILFSIQESRSICEDEKKLNHLIRLFIQKEQDPTSISTVRLMEEVGLASHDQNLQETVQWLKRLYEYLFRFEDRLRNPFLMKYEDFVHERLSELESYLGFPLEGKALVDEPHDHVPRTLSSGDWRNWFTPQDVNFFRPLFAAHMLHYGYEDEWELPGHQVVRTEHCSEYIRRTVNKRKKDRDEIPRSFSGL